MVKFKVRVLSKSFKKYAFAGQWLARPPVSDQTPVRDPVEAYVNCSSLLWYNLIARVRPCLMN